jgi:hypothetical protein
MSVVLSSGDKEPLATINKPDPFIAVYAEIGLVHAIKCQNPMCYLNSCLATKSLMKHVKNCTQFTVEEGDEKNEINGKCDKCIQYWEIVKLHAKSCSDDDCPIEKCKTLRPSIDRQRLMNKISSATSGSVASGSVIGSNVSNASKSSNKNIKTTGSFVDAGERILQSVQSLAAMLPGRSSETNNIGGGESGEESNLVAKKTSSPAIGLKPKTSFISVGPTSPEGTQKFVPVLPADEAYPSTGDENDVPTTVKNPMFEDEKGQTVPKLRRRWWCGA